MSRMISRRRMLGGAGVLAAAMTLPLGRAMAEAAYALPPIPIPPPIGSAERLQRLAGAKALMKRNGIGAVLVEPGPSLDYFTGIQWWRSERLTGVSSRRTATDYRHAVLRAAEHRRNADVPAEIRTWEEDEEPLKLVADFLTAAKSPGSRSGSRRPIAFS